MKLYEEAIRNNPVDSITLNSYGTALASANKFDQAFEQFEHALKIEPNDTVSLFVYANHLEIDCKFEDAIIYFEKMLLYSEKLIKVHIEYLYFKLGQLYYQTQQKNEGRRYFDLAVEQADQQDAAKLRTAQEILAIKPYNTDATNILREINENSSVFTKARKTLSLDVKCAEKPIFY